MPDDDARDADRAAEEQTRAVGGEPTRELPQQEQSPWSSPGPGPGPAGPDVPPAAEAVQGTDPPPSNPYAQPPGYPPPPAQYGPPPAQYGPPPAQYGPPPAQYGPPPAQYGPTTSGRATVVLVCGIASLVLPFVGWVAAIVALVLAGGAKREIESSGGKLTGLGLVKAGRICSWIAIALTLLFVALVVVLGVIGATTDGFSGPTYRLGSAALETLGR